MKVYKNMYCTGDPCLCTRKFLDKGSHYMCTYCGKTLKKVIDDNGIRNDSSAARD